MGAVLPEVILLSYTQDAETVIERCGRVAYQSQDKITEESKERFIKSIIKSRHESVLEHASATFLINGVSRAFTHQLVRHRICSYTQQSQRYVNEFDFNYIVPPSIKNNAQAMNEFLLAIDYLQTKYQELQKLGIKNEDCRFILPNMVESQISITANFREWRHILTLRGDKYAQWEIREVIIIIAEMLKYKFPYSFYDFIIDKEKQLVIKKGE